MLTIFVKTQFVGTILRTVISNYVCGGAMFFKVYIRPRKAPKFFPNVLIVFKFQALCCTRTVYARHVNRRKLTSWQEEGGKFRSFINFDGDLIHSE